jgi:acyl-CoA synthetase (AMP-forming)/AMP-acid ligase II
VIVLPKFDFSTFLRSIAEFKINELFVVPPIVIMMTKNLDMCRKYDLSSVRFLFSGAAPLGKESVKELQTTYPDWKVCQAYGLTETSTVVSSQSRVDIWPGSSGTLLPGVEARIVTVDGKEIHDYNIPGELWVKGPNVTLGYLKNAPATAETFIEDASGRWLKTGDEVEFRKNPDNGAEHLWVVDRIKELIKVKVSKHLLTIPPVSSSLIQTHRGTKLLPQSSRHIFSRTPSWPIVPLFQCPTKPLERCPKPTL